MRLMKLVPKRLCRVVGVVYNLMTHSSLGKLYVDSTMPAPALETIKLIKVKRGWSWKGEYNIIAQDSYSLEILMYDLEGALRIVHFNSNGDIAYTYILEDVRFCVCQ